ncbi:exo 1,3/1,4-beta-D-glucan glucohydrolase [Marinimicrobium sp. ABcell2]|uniref:glycoside hydrolase family 3 protein n=1 Tax=Marinimicrobium sp. ABcell2 TaxID=3069751 RepID=UPI0027B5E69E|nr:exo 1,3/1,4-beta-D-glucan glucohydrolase [Marinimicrobium sp. ABcell2]MDQ2076615.1 exo 1,3/1,4-beta-D-glucan glucohydrolase [Marinimicrobium sp. ABcell2]
MRQPLLRLRQFGLTRQLSTIGIGMLLASLVACSGLREEPGTDPNRWPQLTNPLANEQAVEEEVNRLLERMTVEQKVGQLIQPELRNITPEQIRQYHIGSLLNGGGSYPNGDKYASVDDWLALADSFYLASMDERDGGIAIPIIWGTDAVHGHNNVVGATLFPHNIGLGAANNPELIRKINEITALEVAVTGMDWNFSPTVAVARDDRWGRTYEAYAESPELVKAYAGEAVNGLQGQVGTESFFGPGRLIATAKHFVGDGGTQDGVDRADARMSEEKLRDIHSPGYFSAIEAGVQTVMASFNSWNGVMLHGHEYLLTDVLKERMGFDGLVVGDWNGHEFVDGCTRDSCAQAFNAGVDIFMAPDNWQALYANTLAQVNSGEISQARLDDAVRRILRVKLRAGMFEKGLPSERPYAGQSELLGAPEHRAVARQAVRESLVLLKNNGGLLPLDRHSRVLVAGDGAHDIGKQSGGWSVTWQGTGNTNDDFPGGTSIYQGIAEIVTAAGGQVELQEDGHYQERPDVAIVVFGEDPYAEMQGDVSHLNYTSDTDLALLQRLQNQGIPVVSVFITGRPLWVNAELNVSDAFVVAWLPGSEGAGVADVLFRDDQGAVNHDFKGQLSFSWPANAVQSPLNDGQDDYQPLFEYGYGLTYADRDHNLPILPEESGISATDGTEVLDIFRDRPLAPWELVIADGSRRHLPVTGSGASVPGVTVQSIDRYVQEDSRRLQWSGDDLARVSLQATQRTDLEPYLAERAALQFDLRVDTPPSAEIVVGMACGQDCGAELDLTDALSRAPVGEWQTHSVDLQCLSDGGTELALVLVPFYLASAGAMELDLHHVRIVPDAATQQPCE